MIVRHCLWVVITGPKLRFTQGCFRSEADYRIDQERWHVLPLNERRSIQVEIWGLP